MAPCSGARNCRLDSTATTSTLASPSPTAESAISVVQAQPARVSSAAWLPAKKVPLSLWLGASGAVR